MSSSVHMSSLGCHLKPYAGTFSNSSRVCVACDAQCTLAAGCVGPGPTQCLACQSFLNGRTCVATCPTGMYADASRVCRQCNSLCSSDGCRGPLDTDCFTCAGLARLGSTGLECIAACQALEYANNGLCTPCDGQCQDGCTGPGPAACVGRCARFQLNGTCVPGSSQYHASSLQVLCRMAVGLYQLH